MITANKGEWSELYVLLKLFSEHDIAAADQQLQPTGHIYTFLKVFREDVKNNPLTYELLDKNVVKISNENGISKTISVPDLPYKTQRIFQQIQDSTQSAFELPDAENLMQTFLLKKIKAGSADKSDIVASIKDDIVSETNPTGFSIKSQIGGASTLLNASSGTNFIYKIKGFTGKTEEINSIETRSKIRDRLNSILATGAELEFQGLSSISFTNNMQIIDFILPNILSEILLNYYLGKGNRLSELCDLYNGNKNAVVFKIKSLIRAIALGMVPQTEWDTRLSSYGGYIVVRNDGMLLCYHLYNDDDFKDYLFNNTKLDTPSSTRHNFGYIYERDGELFINLNLQIRFLR